MIDLSKALEKSRMIKSVCFPLLDLCTRSSISETSFLKGAPLPEVMLHIVHKSV